MSEPQSPYQWQTVSVSVRVPNYPHGLYRYQQPTQALKIKAFTKLLKRRHAAAMERMRQELQSE